MKAHEIAEVIEQLAPLELAEEWDNPGLLIGRGSSEIKKIMVALDINSCVAEKAVEYGADMVVTHHPVIFSPLKNISDECILKLIENKICVYSAHTNLDNCNDGVNKVLSELVGIKNTEKKSMLVTGNITETYAEDFIKTIKNKFKINAVRHTKVDKNKRISKVAVLGGSGGDFVDEAIFSQCDAFVTGETSYHHASKAYEAGLLLICVGHYESEYPVCHMLGKYLKEKTGLEIFEHEYYNTFISE